MSLVQSELDRIEFLQFIKQKKGLHPEREIELNDLLDRKKAEDAAKKALVAEAKKKKAVKARSKVKAKKVAKKQSAKAKRKKK